MYDALVASSVPESLIPPREAAVWLHPEQLPLVRAIGELTGLRFVAAGTGVPGRSGELAAALGAEPLTDLRNALASLKTPLVLLASADALGEARPAEDAAVLRAAGERGVRVASLEPLPASIEELAASAGELELEPGRPGAVSAWPVMVPRSCRARAVREVLELRPQFGTVHAASIECVGGPVHGTLGSRLADAMELALELLGEPERIDATCRASEDPPALRAGARGSGATTDSLRGIHGDLGAHLRYADGRCATVLASSRAAKWDVRITLIGEGGRVLRGGAESFEWRSGSGELVDQTKPRRPKKGAAGAGSAGSALAAADPVIAELMQPGGLAAACAEQISMLLSGAAASTLGATGMDASRVLAMSQAALLSSRTGQAESPGTILRMGGMAG